MTELKRGRCDFWTLDRLMLKIAICISLAPILRVRETE